MKINVRIKRYIRPWLNIQENKLNNVFIIQSGADLRIEQLKHEKRDSVVPGNYLFWRTKLSKDMPIRRIHMGLSALIVDKLAVTVIDDQLNERINKRYQVCIETGMNARNQCST